MFTPEALKNDIKHLKAIQFANEISVWYAEHKRDLPFRKTRDPYKILVSEIMLQQTQMSTAIPYFERFIATFPTIQALAAAALDDVRKLWQGLGYYTRATYLHDIAKTIVSKYGGIFPKSYDDIRALKGVGEYTAAALCAIAFDEPRAAIDGNVRRVMSRVLAVNFSKTAHDTCALETILSELLRNVPPRVFTEALMELGAIVCQKKAQCPNCPLKVGCRANIRGVVERYPEPTTPSRRRHVHYSVLVANDDAGRFLWRRRPEYGLLAGLYEFPQYECGLEDALNKIEVDYCVSVREHDKLCAIKHVFSHVTWHLDVYYIRIQTNAAALPGDWRVQQPGAMSRAHLKINDCLKKKNIVSFV